MKLFAKGNRRSGRSKREREPVVDRKAIWRARGQTAARVGLWTGRIGLCVVGVAAVVFGAIRLRSWAKTSTRFALKQIHIEYLDPKGTPLKQHPGITDADLVKLLSTPTGTNYFNVVAKTAAREVSTHPWVRSATGQKHLPGRLALKVVLRQPAAVATLGGLYLVDDTGEAFKRVVAGEDPGLVVITGVSRDDYVGRPVEARARLRDAMAAARDYERRRPAGLGHLGEVNSDEAGAITLYTAPQSSKSLAVTGAKAATASLELRLGTGDRERKLVRLSQTVQALGPELHRARAVYLDHVVRQDRVVISMADPSPSATDAKATPR